MASGKNRFIYRLGYLSIALWLCACTSPNEALREAFRHPENKYRPVPFWHINGELTGDGIRERLAGARVLSGFGGVAVLPVGKTLPAYLSEAYFDRYGDILALSEKQGTEVILYDDIDFPSGSAGGQLQAKFPRFTRKYLVKDELLAIGPKRITIACPDTGLYLPMAVAAMNTRTLQVTDLKEQLRDARLTWNVPDGEWRIMFFGCKFNVSPLVDYMQPEAVEKFIEMTYDVYATKFGQYFGNVITKTFYDDVGFVHQEETWTPAITAIFEQKYQKNVALYYPALYYDIGAETQAARIAFYDIRSELMAEGYVRQVAEWSAQHRLESMGHPPENYSANTTVANGDILKYYRHTHIPLMDAIFFHGRGIHGYKQVSSAADRDDKPVVGAELYGAFPANTDSLMLYRVAMEVMARGVNFIVPHGMWYDADPEQIHIPPLISYENPLLAAALPRYSDYVARCCMLLQGGTRVADLALLWPINAIQAESYINRDKLATSPNRVEALSHTILSRANWTPDHVNHHVLSDLLTNELRRDFTFIHPEDLCNGKITPDGALLRLNNAENRQEYKLLLMPGGAVISAETLKAVLRYYEGGGKVIATELLPSKSAEFGRDAEVTALVEALFGDRTETLRTNEHGGIAAFIPTTDKAGLENLFARMALSPDVVFAAAAPASGNGYINYIHKQKADNDIYFLSNSTDVAVASELRLSGRLQPEWWNPHTGDIRPVAEYRYEKGENEQEYTVFQASLAPVSSAFIISSKK
jgi:hypothetical protein